ncbi:hypothetical protein RQP46_002911 [Phenoliferia psychrophenolica]
MPFAHAPIGDLRLRRPVVPPPTTTGIIPATAYGPACVQQGGNSNSLKGVPPAVADVALASPAFGVAMPDSEDCLTINVDRPAGLASNASVPIIVWIYVTFHAGSTEMYQHKALITRSVALGSPVIHIAANYRLAAYGFLAGKEVVDAGVANLGLQDQREALRWVQKYAASFGGDPTRVTLWGESAGAASAGFQMVSTTATTESTFRAAFIDSGGVLALGSALQPSKQATHAMELAPSTMSYNGVRFAYEPATDGPGGFFPDDPQKILMAGNYSRIPIVHGDCEDEGTLFSTSQSNITTNELFLQYIKEVFLPEASDAEIASLAAAYPDDVTAGSPYYTGQLNELYTNFKRISAFQGDLWFHGPRRLLLNKIYDTVPRLPSWSFLYKRQKNLPFLGAFHASDLFIETGFQVTGNYAPLDESYHDALINLAVHLDPNTPADRAPGVSPLIDWPQWTPGGQLLTFVDSESFATGGPAAQNPTGLAGTVASTPPRGLILTLDTFRVDAINVLNGLFQKYPF